MRQYYNDLIYDKWIKKSPDQPGFGLMFFRLQLIFEYFFELFKFGTNDKGTVRLIAVLIEIILVIVLGFEKFCERGDLGYDRIVECL